MIRIESAEVEKSKRSAVHQKIASGLGHVPVWKVPISNVERGIAHDAEPGDERWSEIGPTLIHKDSTRQIDDAMVVQPRLPPFDKRQRLFGSRDAEKAQIVNAGPQNIQFRRVRSLVQRLGQVRSEDHRMILQPGDQCFEVGAHQDVGVQIQDEVEIIVAEQMIDGVRLDGGTQLQQRVFEMELPGMRNRRAVSRNDRERLAGGVETLIDLIGQHDETAPFGMELRDGIQHAPGASQVVSSRRWRRLRRSRGGGPPQQSTQPE
jgi:hypothetical protein